jgi:hypothetical protein
MRYLSFNEGFEALARKTKEEIKILVAPGMKIGGFRGLHFSRRPFLIPYLYLLKNRCLSFMNRLAYLAPYKP